jgi:hypothetical protein
MRIFLLIVTLLLSGYSYSYNPFPILGIQQESCTVTSENRSTNNNCASDKNPLVVRVLENTKSPDDVAKENAEKQASSAIERRLANWTVILAVATIFLVIVAVIQMGMFWKQLGVMQNSLRDGNEVAKATTKSANTLEDTARKQLRAYVGIEGFEYQLSTAADATQDTREILTGWAREKPSLFVTRFAVQPRWKNYGDTPTKKMRIRVWRRFSDIDTPATYEYSPTIMDFFLAPDAIATSEPIEINSIRIVIEDGMKLLGKRPVCYIFGRADYEDVFGVPHWIEWCNKINVSAPDGKKLVISFTQWGEYNRSDVN